MDITYTEACLMPTKGNLELNKQPFGLFIDTNKEGSKGNAERHSQVVQRSKRLWVYQ
jgi:hypothetical protein